MSQAYAVRKGCPDSASSTSKVCMDREPRVWLAQLASLGHPRVPWVSAKLLPTVWKSAFAHLMVGGPVDMPGSANQGFAPWGLSACCHSVDTRAATTLRVLPGFVLLDVHLRGAACYPDVEMLTNSSSLTGGTW